MAFLLGGGGIELSTKKTLCKICVNLIGTSWHLVAQLATGVTVSLNKITVNKSLTCFGSRGSEVQILSSRPFKTRTYGNRCRSFFLCQFRVNLNWELVKNFYIARRPSVRSRRVYSLQLIGLIDLNSH